MSTHVAGGGVRPASFTRSSRDISMKPWKPYMMWWTRPSGSSMIFGELPTHPPYVFSSFL